MLDADAKSMCTGDTSISNQSGHRGQHESESAHFHSLHLDEHQDYYYVAWQCTASM